MGLGVPAEVGVGVGVGVGGGRRGRPRRLLSGFGGVGRPGGRWTTRRGGGCHTWVRASSDGPNVAAAKFLGADAGPPFPPSPGAVDASPPPSPPPWWMERRVGQAAATAAVGAAFFALPAPSAVGPAGWHLLGVFLATICGIVLSPLRLPLGAVALCGLCASVLTGTMPLATALGATRDPVPWLVFAAFLIARAVVKCGLGRRCAYAVVARCGGSTVGLCYALVLAEAAVAPAMPSVTARGGGIFVPIIRAIAEAGDSHPTGEESARRLGAYLLVTSFQCAQVTSAMFLTAMASNSLSASLAQPALGAPLGWAAWASAAALPGAVSLLLLPAFVRLIYPPTRLDSPEAPRLAREELGAMGPVSVDEALTASVMALLVLAWIFGPALAGVSAVTAALTGVCALLALGVLDWDKDCLGEGAAWDTLLWFAVLIGMAKELSARGVVTAATGVLTQALGQVAGLGWAPSLAGLVLVYLYSHYLFASLAAHIGAMFPAFLAVAISTGSPPGLAALTLAFASALMGGLTHYGCGSAPVYFGTGYVQLRDWLRVGALCSVLNLTVWLAVGAPWWKFLGLY